MLNIINKSIYEITEELGIPFEAYSGREGYLTVTSQPDGTVVLVSLQDEDHRILEVLWEKK